LLRIELGKPAGEIMRQEDVQILKMDIRDQDILIGDPDSLIQ
jgi:hypothetical protein